jgi:hypothetical protein
MKFSGSQYPVRERTYVFVKEEKDGKIIGRFVRPEFGLVPFRAIYLKYSSGPEEGGKRKFRMDLWNGLNNSTLNSEHVKTEKGTVSRYSKKLNEDFEGKVKSMIDEALKLPEE